MITYDFTEGLYRAKIKTTYKREDMTMTDFAYSEPFEFESTHVPVVPPEYQDYVDLINGANYTTKYYLTDNWIVLLGSYTLPSNFRWTKDIKKYSYVNIRTTTYSRPGVYSWNQSYSRYQYVATNKYDQYTGNFTAQIKILEPLNIYINGSGNSYRLTTSAEYPISILKNGNSDVYTFSPYFNTGDTAVKINSYSQSYPETQAFTCTDTLENCFKYAAMNLRNVNIYVNGVLWSKKVS